MTSTDGTPLRVALANDDPIIIEGLRAMLLPFASRVAVVGIAIGDPEIVLTPEEVPEADLLLLDTFDRRAQGVDAARMIMAQDPPFRLVIFTDCTDERFLLQALRLGVHGYLTKSADSAQLVGDLERIAAGETVIDARLATSAALLAARTMDIGAWPGAHLGLTEREAEVLITLAEGNAPERLPEKLGIGNETVRTHLRNIYRKLGVNDRVSAVSIAWQEGLVHRP